MILIDDNGVVIERDVVDAGATWLAEDTHYPKSMTALDLVPLDVPCRLVDGEFVALPPTITPPQVPDAVSMRQARLALLGAGLLAQIDAAIAAMPDVAGEAARIEWEYATEVRRDSALVSGMAAALSLTDAQLDQLFVAAGGL
jgi:preprotein translocase subunit SecE